LKSEDMTDLELDKIEQRAATANDEELLSHARNDILRLVAEARRLHKPVEAARIVKAARDQFTEADDIRTQLYGELKDLEKRLDEALEVVLIEPEEEDLSENLPS
jgi:hypothetical protein